MVTAREIRVLLPGRTGEPLPGDDWLPKQIGGVEVRRDTRIESDKTCTYTYEAGPIGLVELAVSTSRPKDRPKSPCAVAEEYLAAVLPIWQNPPLRSAGLTEPRLSLANVDPCVLAAEILPMVARDTADGGAPDRSGLSPTSPYECEALGPEGHLGPSIGVKLTAGENPVANPPGDGEQDVQIAGRRGRLTRHERVRGGGWCKLTLQVGDTTIDMPEADTVVEIIEVRASDCETAMRAGETSAKKVES